MISIEVAYATPERQLILNVQVPEGTSMAQAIWLSGIADEFPEIDLENYKAGIWSKVEKKPAERILKLGDRIEIYRPLLIDPKQARRNRAEKKES